MARKTKKIDFEHSMSELETLVEKMESGEFTLEESVKQFERGIALARSCQQALKDAEQKVHKLLTAESGEESLEAFDENLDQGAGSE